MANLVYNSGENLSLYYNVLDYFKTIMKNHPQIAHVSQGDVFGIDDKEFPMYPIGNVLISGATFGDKSTEYGIQLIIADKLKTLENESDGRTNEQVVPFYWC